MDARSIRAIGVVGLMYMTQGIVYGFASFVLLPRLAQAGVPIESQTGIVALAGVPWVFKLAWGPVLDRFGGRVRTFACVAMVVIGACLLWLATRGALEQAMQDVVVAWLLLNVALSLQDVATDAMALDAIAPGRRGLANGVMLGAHHVGLEAVGGLGLGFITAAHGMSTALAVQGGLVLALAAAPGVMPRPTHASTARLRWSSLHAAMRGRTGLLAVAATVFAADVLTSSLSAEFWVHRLQWTAEEISESVPLVLVGASLGAHVLAASVSDRLGHRATAVIGSAGLGAVWLAFSLLEPAWSSRTFMLGFVAVQAIPTGLLYVGVHALLMDGTEPQVRATHFAVLTTLLNLPRAAAPAVAPGLLSGLGWSGTFVAAAAFQVIMAAALHRVPTGTAR